MQKTLLAVILVLALSFFLFSCADEDEIVKNDRVIKGEDGTITIFSETSLSQINGIEYRLVITDDIWRSISVMRRDRDEILVQFNVTSDGRSSVIIYPAVHWFHTQRPYCTFVRSFDEVGRADKESYYRSAFNENGYRFQCIEMKTDTSVYHSATKSIRETLLKILLRNNVSQFSKRE